MRTGKWTTEGAVKGFPIYQAEYSATLASVKGAGYDGIPESAERRLRIKVAPRNLVILPSLTKQFVGGGFLFP